MSLKDKIKEGIEEVEKEKEQQKLKTKKWRIPSRAKVGKAKQKLNWVGIFKINENGNFEPSKQQIIEQTTMVDGVPRLATPEYILRWHQGRQTFPVIFQPSWSVLPLKPTELPSFNPEESQKESMLNGSNIKGYKILLNRMEMTKMDEKKHIGGWWKWVLGAGLLALLGYALWSGSLF